MIGPALADGPIVSRWWSFMTQCEVAVGICMYACGAAAGRTGLVSGLAPSFRDTSRPYVRGLYERFCDVGAGRLYCAGRGDCEGGLINDEMGGSFKPAGSGVMVRENEGAVVADAGLMASRGG